MCIDRSRYATILLKEGSNYNQIHNEEVFFEALCVSLRQRAAPRSELTSVHARSYDFTARVTHTKFDQKYWHIVECELGRMFRSPGFNKQFRKSTLNEQPVKHLPARELWRQRERQRQNAHLVGARSGTSSKQPRADTGRIPLYGLVAATGRSPIILSAFRTPVPPGQTPPPSTASPRCVVLPKLR
jgi:hypothetical protein